MSTRQIVWVFRDSEDVWNVRCEGEAAEYRCLGRDQAVALARGMLAACASYRLYLQLRNGRFVTEYLN